MINKKKRLLNTLNRKLLFSLFWICLAVVVGTMGCSDSGGGSSKNGYFLRGYDGVVDDGTTGQALVSAVGNENLKFYAEFPWFVNLTYQVQDGEDRGVGNLAVNDFTVLEDGTEVSKLTSEMNIRKRDALPSAYSYGIKTVLFLDNTPSAAVSLEKMLECGQVIVDNLDEKQQQEIAIVAYDETGEAEMVQDFTNDLSLLNQSLSFAGGIQQSFGTTNFYGGVISALALWEDNHSPENPDFQQGFLVAVTDGKDTAGLQDADDAIGLRGDKKVFVVAVGDDIPEYILNDLERLGNAGFYHVTDPQMDPDEGWDKKENLCEHMLEVQNRMIAYADGFYWLRYKTATNSASQPSLHAVKLSVINNRNKDADSQISGTFNSDVLFSGEPDIYFNTTAADPNGLYDEDTGITEKTIMLERGQGVGDVAETITAITYKKTGAGPSQYNWSSGKTSVVTVKADNKDSAKAVVTVVGPGDATITVTDTVNNISQTFTVNVKIREEGFQMLRHAVTSIAPWFADATFQVRKTYDPAEYNEDTPWLKQWEWVTDLAREDMTVLENGIQVDMENQELNLRKRDNIPSNYSYTLKTVLHIDNSPSVAANLDLIKDAAKAFVRRALVDDPSDNTDLGPLVDANSGVFQQEIAVISYDESGDTMIVQEFTIDPDTATEAIDTIVRGYGPIDFYDGMLESLRLWTTDHSPYDAGDDFVQGVVVVMSDGWQSNPGFNDRQAVLDETGSKQIICVSVGDDLVSENSADLFDFSNAGFYSVPDPAHANEATLRSDDGQKTTEVAYSDLELVLMGIQDNAVYPYANSFYWLNYKSALDPAPICERAETMTISINNNNNPSAGKNVTGPFESCTFFEGIDGMIYVNQTVTNPDGITGHIDLQYVMLGNIPMIDPTYPLEAFTYDNDGIRNTPAYEWAVSNQNIVRITPVSGSYANSRAILSLPAFKRPGSASLRIDDTGNSVWKSIFINVSEFQLPGPIAYYPFNGNADDATGNGYDGEAFGATLTADRNGNPNSAYSFDGNNHIALDAFYGPGAGAIGPTYGDTTVCAWVKTSSGKTGGYIVSFNYDAYWDLSFYKGYINCSAIYNGEYKSKNSVLKYNDNRWHFVTATITQTGEIELYIDGKFVDTTFSVGARTPINDTRYGFIGARSLADTYGGAVDSRYYYEGVIDDVIIFDQILTPETIDLLAEIMK